MRGHPHGVRWTLLGVAVVAIAVSMTAPSPARAGGMSFTGTFTLDNDVQLIPFTLSTTSDVAIETLSYAGGTNFAGQAIPAGGFDPIVTLFGPSGNLINFNDDGANVRTDPTTGAAFDAFLQVSGLAPGRYTVSVTQYDNFAKGPTLNDGFSEGANTNFTLAFAPTGSTGFFWDVTQHERTGNWAADILTSSSAAVVPEPSALLLGGIGLIGALGLARRYRTKPAV